MKIASAIFVVFIMGCSTRHGKIQIPPLVKSDTNVITMTCTVYQYNGADSLNQVVARVTDYCMNGKIATELLNDYMGRDGKYLYYYQDTLLVARKYASDNQDSTQTMYTYDSEGKLVREEHYDYKRRLKENTGRQSDVLSEDDFEKEKSWAVTSQINYTYDQHNRKIEYYAPSIHWDDQNRYTWTYDETGQVKEHRSYQHEKIIWTEEFRYNKNTISFKRTWFDSGDISQGIRALDDKGNVIEEIITDKKDEFVKRTRYKYNDDGLLNQSVSYDKDDNPVTTYHYVYDKTTAGNTSMPAAGGV